MVQQFKEFPLVYIPPSARCFVERSGWKLSVHLRGGRIAGLVCCAVTRSFAEIALALKLGDNYNYLMTRIETTFVPRLPRLV